MKTQKRGVQMKDLRSFLFKKQACYQTRLSFEELANKVEKLSKDEEDSEDDFDARIYLNSFYISPRF